MEIIVTGLPVPPDGFNKKVVEWRQVCKGEKWCGLDGWGDWVHDLESVWPVLVAIPAKLTGTDWLDAQKPGAMFRFRGEWFWIAKSREIGAGVVPSERFEDFALRHDDANLWLYLAKCFPNGHEDLSDDTCEILYPRP